MRAIASVLSVLLIVIYPVLVYVGLARMSVRSAALLLLVVLLPGQLLRLWRSKREHLLAVLPLPLGAAALLAAAAIVDDPHFILALPVLINLLLMIGFGSSLRRGKVPTVERFARMQVDDLSEAELRYCRRVTWVWCGVFLVNGGVTMVLAVAAPISWWTAYAGGIAYGVVGMVAAVEYLLRKALFRRYGKGLHDRLFRRLFPPRQSP